MNQNTKTETKPTLPCELHAMQTLASTELTSVSGGLTIVDVSGMPDRTVMCGTMWYLDQLLKKFGQGRV